MDGQIELPSEKNWFAIISIAVSIIGILSFAYYIVDNMQVLNAYLLSLFSSALGFVLGIVGLSVGLSVKEGRGLASVGIALSGILLLVLFPFLLTQ